jgi:septal ring factor EnvC (AmiA/AmiB activator)
LLVRRLILVGKGKQVYGPILLLLGSLLAANLPGLQARQDQASGMDKNEAASRLLQLQKDISELQQRLNETRAEHQGEQAQLRKLDLAMQENALKFRGLETQHANHLQKLNKLQVQRDEHVRNLRQRQDQLARQINATYRLASQSRVKLVLNQDNPAQISRMLAYYDHINRAQVEKINTLKAVLAELEQIYRMIDEELSRIKMVQNEQQQVQDQQRIQRAERENLLAALAVKIDNEAAQLLELERNREDLEKLLEKLSNVLADIPADLGQHLDVAALKGKLPLPVNGRVLHAFGQRRAAGMDWQGWLMEAATGTEVSSIAYGRVAFADWLRGYGLLMIIDHGQGFMSLYGYNESLLWEVGDWVEPGAIIATVGGSQGGEQGFYFEMRKNGKAVDPAAWLKR